MFASIFKINFLFFTIINAIVIIFVGFMLYDDLQIQHYPETTCTIVATKIVPQSRSYTPKAQLAYTINGKPYLHWTEVSHRSPYVDTEALANQRLTPYQVNTQVKCWYDPANPNIIIMDKGFRLHAYLLAFSLLLFMIWIWTIKIFSRVQDKKITPGYAPDGSLFQIKENRYSTELIYYGESKATPDMLPEKYKKYGDYGKRKIINDLNKKGSFVSIKAPFKNYIYATLVLLFILVFFGDDIIRYFSK